MVKPNKQRFIDAYTYCYGETKKRANEIFKSASAEYIDAVIKSFERDCTMED